MPHLETSAAWHFIAAAGWCGDGETQNWPRHCRCGHCLYSDRQGSAGQYQVLPDDLELAILTPTKKPVSKQATSARAPMSQPQLTSSISSSSRGRIFDEGAFGVVRCVFIRLLQGFMDLRTMRGLEHPGSTPMRRCSARNRHVCANAVLAILLQRNGSDWCGIGGLRSTAHGGVATARRASIGTESVSGWQV